MLNDYSKLLRPKHWIKNIFLFAGIVFGKELLKGQPLLVVLQGFVCFCGLSSAAYIFNDLWDRQADQQHGADHKRQSVQPIVPDQPEVPGLGEIDQLAAQPAAENRADRTHGTNHGVAPDKLILADEGWDHGLAAR